MTMHRPCSRRDWLRRTAAAVPAAWLAASPLGRAAAAPAQPVAVARCKTYESAELIAALNTMFDQLGGLGRLVAGKTVAIKINLTGSPTYRLGYVPAWRGWLRRFTRPDVQLALESLERVGLIAHAAQRADTLSGGQQQRVAIARALTQQPDVILADEPVASLDPRSGEGILELLRGICHTEKDGVAVICSLHQPSFARRFADRVVGLAGGRIVVDIAAGELVESTLRAVYGAGSAELDS